MTEAQILIAIADRVAEVHAELDSYWSQRGAVDTPVRRDVLQRLTAIEASARGVAQGLDLRGLTGS